MTAPGMVLRYFPAPPRLVPAIKMELEDRIRTILVLLHRHWERSIMFIRLMVNSRFDRLFPEE